MPLGVSEGLIEKAYGPIDYTGFYKGLDAAAKKMAADEKAASDAAKKEYALNLANFNKSSNKVRAIDAPDVAKLWGEYSNIRKQQIKNPNLFKENPTKYAELEETASTKYAELSTLVQGSKELNNLSPEFKKRVLNETTRKQYDVDAEKNWITNVDNKKYKDVVANDFHNESKYFRKDVDVTKFYDGLGNDILKKAVTEPIVLKTEKNEDGIPVIYKTKFNQFPDIEKIRNTVESNLNSYFKVSGEKERVVDQEINNLTKTGEVDKTLKRWNDLKDADFKDKYGIEKPKNLVDANGQMITGASKEEQLVKLLTMKNYLDFLPTRGEDLEPEVPKSFILQWQERQRVLGRQTKEEKLFDARPIGDKISKDPTQLYSEGVKLKDFVNKNMGVVGNLILLTKAPLTKKEDIEAFGESKNILKKLGLNENSTAEQYAAAMEAENKKAGFPDLKVPPRGLASGKIFTMTWQEKDASGNLQSRMLTIDLQNQLSLDKLTQLVRSKTAAKKSVSGEALKINTGGGGGYFDNI